MYIRLTIHVCTDQGGTPGHVAGGVEEGFNGVNGKRYYILNCPEAVAKVFLVSLVQQWKGTHLNSRTVPSI